MRNGKKAGGSVLYSLILLDDFKVILGIDDREDKLAKFCLVTATHTIEQYCKRRLLKKTHTDYLCYYSDYILPLREYPVRKIVQVSREQVEGRSEQGGEIVDPKYYYCLPDAGICEDIPFSLVLRAPLSVSTKKAIYKVRYSFGYDAGKVPPDLASACLELAAWNMNRYRGRRIGMTGNARSGEQLEMAMPENVRFLLEPYKRKMI